MNKKVYALIVVVMVALALLLGYMVYWTIWSHRELWSDIGTIKTENPFVAHDSLFGTQVGWNFTIATHTHGLINYQLTGAILDHTRWNVNATVFVKDHADGFEVYPV